MLPSFKHLPKKPQYIHVTNDFDIFQLFQNIEREYRKLFFILESLGEQNQHARYAVIGFGRPSHLGKRKCYRR